MVTGGAVHGNTENVIQNYVNALEVGIWEECGGVVLSGKVGGMAIGVRWLSIVE